MAKVEIDLGTLTNSCFVIMPFSPTFQSEYDRVIQPAVKAVGLVSIRADEIYSKPQVTADIWKCLRCARVVVAELTGKNTNVFYEVGLAHALGKSVIIITRNEDDVPFDLKALRYIYYETDDPFWGENLKTALVNMLKKLLKEEEFGTVFEGITIEGKIEYEKRKLPSKEVETKPLYDMSGFWKGTWIARNRSYSCDLSLSQIGDRLIGSMTVSVIFDNDTTVVQESMVGEIKEDAVDLHGVSYSFIKQGKLEEYYLDILQLKVSSKGKEMSGSTGDQEGIKGKASFTREIVKRNAS
jgi:hypothetical protein